MTVQATNKVSVPTFLPVFNGFYGTWFETIIDQETDWVIEDYNENNEGNFYYDDFDFDFQKLMNEILSDCTGIVNDKLNEIGIKCKIEFESMVSPKYYNFQNDSANVTIHFEDFTQVMDILRDNYEAFRVYILERYRSYDGFISSHSEYASDWIDELENDTENCSHKVGAVLDFILQELNGYTDSELYEDVTSNGFYGIDWDFIGG